MISMETMGKSELLQWTEEDREKVLAYYSKTAKTMRADIETVKEWLKHLPHIPELPRKPFFQVQKKNYTHFWFCSWCAGGEISLDQPMRCGESKTEIRELLYSTDANSGIFQQTPLEPWNERSRSPMVGVRPFHLRLFRFLSFPSYCIPLPKLYNLYRIITFKVACEPEQIDVEKYICNTLNVAELILLDDYKVADIFITDLTQTTLKHTILVSPLLTRKMFAVVRNAYSDIKTIQVHFIVSGAFWETGIAILKSCMGAKVKERVRRAWSSPVTSLIGGFLFLYRCTCTKTFNRYINLCLKSTFQRILMAIYNQCLSYLVNESFYCENYVWHCEIS